MGGKVIMGPIAKAVTEHGDAWHHHVKGPLHSYVFAHVQTREHMHKLREFLQMRMAIRRAYPRHNWGMYP